MGNQEKLEATVRKIMEERVSPLLRTHGGDAELHQVTPEGVVRVRLTGACSTCPGAQHTLTKIVAGELKEKCAEIKEVIAVGGVSEDLLAEARRILYDRSVDTGLPRRKR